MASTTAMTEPSAPKSTPCPATAPDARAIAGMSSPAV